MRKIFTAIILASAPLALAACGEKAAAPEETVVTDETVVEEPAADAMAPATGDAADDAGKAATGEVTEKDDAPEGSAEEK